SLSFAAGFLSVTKRNTCPSGPASLNPFGAPGSPGCGAQGGVARPAFFARALTRSGPAAEPANVTETRAGPAASVIAMTYGCSPVPRRYAVLPPRPASIRPHGPVRNWTAASARGSSSSTLRNFMGGLLRVVRGIIAQAPYNGA